MSSGIDFRISVSIPIEPREAASRGLPPDISLLRVVRTNRSPDTDAATFANLIWSIKRPQDSCNIIALGAFASRTDALRDLQGAHEVLEPSGGVRAGELLSLTALLQRWRAEELLVVIGSEAEYASVTTLKRGFVAAGHAATLSISPGNLIALFAVDHRSLELIGGRERVLRGFLTVTRDEGW